MTVTLIEKMQSVLDSQNQDKPVFSIRKEIERWIVLARELEQMSNINLLGPFSFAFDDPGLSDGIPFYTPEIGDILVGGIIKITTIWDETDPPTRGDIGQFTTTQSGLISNSGVTNGGWYMRDALVVNSGISFVGAGLGEYGGFFFFDTVDPLKFLVSTNGQPDGDDPGSTQGGADIYIMITNLNA